MQLPRSGRYSTLFRTALLVVPFFLTAILLLPRRIPWEESQNKALAQRDAGFATDVQFVRSQPGRVICEDLLVCFEAGKPYVFDAFNVDQLVKTGTLPESQVLQLLASHQFSGIQISFHSNEPVTAAPRDRFSANFMRQLLTAYRPVLRTFDSVMFLPN